MDSHERPGVLHLCPGCRGLGIPAVQIAGGERSRATFGVRIRGVVVGGEHVGRRRGDTDCGLSGLTCEIGAGGGGRLDEEGLDPELGEVAFQ